MIQLLSAFSTNPDELIYNLEYDIQSATMWFDNNCMKLNKDKCHFIVSNNITEHLWAKVGDELIWESCEEELLGVIIVKNLNCIPSHYLVQKSRSTSQRLGKNCEVFAVPQKKTYTKNVLLSVNFRIVH